MVNCVYEDVVDDQLLLEGWGHLEIYCQKEINGKSCYSIITLKSESAFMEILLENRYLCCISENAPYQPG